MKLLAGPSRAHHRALPYLAVGGLATLVLAVLAPEPPGDAGTVAIVGLGRPAPASAPGTGPRSLALPDRAVGGGDEDASNAFADHSWYVAPSPRPVVKAAPPPPPKPVAPPLPFRFVGSYVEQGGAPVYFLVQGERVYDVRVGDTLDGKYSVDGREGSRLLLTYLPLKEQQALNLEN
jgi:hypothetical protein